MEETSHSRDIAAYILMQDIANLPITNWVLMRHYTLCRMANVACDFDDMPGALLTLISDPEGALASRDFVRQMVRPIPGGDKKTRPSTQSLRHLYLGISAAIIEDAQGNPLAKFPSNDDEKLEPIRHREAKYTALMRAHEAGKIINEQLLDVQSLKTVFAKTSWANTQGEILLHLMVGEPAQRPRGSAPTKAIEQKVENLYSSLVGGLCSLIDSRRSLGFVFAPSEQTDIQVIFANIQNMPELLQRTIQRIADNSATWQRIMEKDKPPAQYRM